MCQNDAHLFVRPDQIWEEFKKVVTLILDVYKDFWLTNYKFRLSLRDPADKEKYFDDDQMWNEAENKLREVLNEFGCPYTEAIWEAAFYWPKLDVEVKPAVGPEVTLSTCQLDFLLPRRFKLEYTDKDGEKKTPVVIHRAIFGTFDRFTAFLLEETKWVFPFWLAPEQVKILPVADPFIDYANKHDMDVALIDSSGIIRYASIENMLTHVKCRLMIDKQDRMHEQLRMGAGYSMDGASIINQLIDRLRSHDDISMELMALGYDRMPSFIEQYLKIVNHSW